MSLLTIVSDAMGAMGLGTPTSVISSTNPTVVQMRSLAHMEAEELRLRGWRSLKVRASLTGDGSSTEYDLPEDFDRFASGEVMFLVDGLWQTLRLVSDEEMIALQTQNVSLLRPVWRLFGDQIEFFPALGDGEEVQLEYRSTYCVTTSDVTTRKPRATADSDVYLVPERIMSAGLIWRFKSEKGFAYDESFRTYEMLIARYLYNDQKRPILRAGKKVFNDGLAAGLYGDVRVIVP